MSLWAGGMTVTHTNQFTELPLTRVMAAANTHMGTTLRFSCLTVVTCLLWHLMPTWYKCSFLRIDYKACVGAQMSLQTCMAHQISLWLTGQSGRARALSHTVWAACEASAHSRWWYDQCIILMIGNL